MSTKLPMLHGLLYHDTKSPRMFTKQTYLSAVRLCPIIAQLPALPAEPTSFDLFVYEPFARAYEGAAQFLGRDANDIPARSRAALDISYSIKYGRYPETWRKLCERLK